MLQSLLPTYSDRLSDPESHDDDFLALYEEFLGKLSSLGGLSRTEMKSCIPGYSPDFRNFQRRYLAIQESRECTSMLDAVRCGDKESSTSLLRSEFAGNAYHRVRDLSRILNLQNSMNVVVAGCGALPSTLLWIHDHYPGTRCVGLDIDSRCLDAARRLLAGLGVESIELVRTDAVRFNYCNADMIFVANQISPKSETLRRIAETASPGAQVVVREPTALGRLFAEAALDDLPPEYMILQQGDISPHFHSYDLFLKLDSPA